MINLADPRVGSKIIFKTDDFFAAANRILNTNTPVFKDGLFDKHGKWMDGWESRRKRTSGHDYIILKLGKPGKISKIDVDTSHFNGNQPSMISIEGAISNLNNTNKLKWLTVLSKKKVKANLKISRVTLEAYLSVLQMAIFLAAASIRLTEVVASLRIPFSH